MPHFLSPLFKTLDSTRPTIFKLLCDSSSPQTPVQITHWTIKYLHQLVIEIRPKHWILFRNKLNVKQVLKQQNHVTLPLQYCLETFEVSFSQNAQIVNGWAKYYLKASIFNLIEFELVSNVRLITEEST